MYQSVSSKPFEFHHSLYRLMTRLSLGCLSPRTKRSLVDPSIDPPSFDTCDSNVYPLLKEIRCNLSSSLAFLHT